MRVWHQTLIPKLTNQQLQAQWRDCINLLKNWGKKNKRIDYVFKYNKEKFIAFSFLVAREMLKREMHPNLDLLTNITIIQKIVVGLYLLKNPLYKEHNEEYLVDCMKALIPDKYEMAYLINDMNRR
jgi:uncharacterized protein (TIGR02328 family)